MSAQRNSYSFKEGLTMMAATAVGIDPYLAAEGGENARAAINAIRNAAKTKTPKDRAGFIREAQAEMRSISAAQHPKLVNALQARVLALQGRGGDTEIAHLTPGEVVVPRSLQTRAVMRTLAMEAHRQRINPARYSVGNRANSINPETGAREFDDGLEEIVVTGNRYPPVTIPRVTKMPYNPWIGRKPFTLGGVYDTMFDAGIDYDSPGDEPTQEPDSFSPLPQIDFAKQISDQDRDYLEKLKAILESTGRKVGVTQGVIAFLGAGLAIVALEGLPVVALVGLSSLATTGSLQVFGWFIEDAVAQIDQILGAK